MKSQVFLTFFLAFLASSATAFPAGSDDEQGPSKEAKGKGRAQSPSPGGYSTPSPQDDPSVPLPGRSGTHTDRNTGLVTGFYGDDRMPGHMRHLERNQAANPDNRRPMGLQSNQPGANQNRPDALRGVPRAPDHRVTKEPQVRDEKPPNSLNHGGSGLSVEYRQKYESDGKHGPTPPGMKPFNNDHWKSEKHGYSEQSTPSDSLTSY